MNNFTKKKEIQKRISFFSFISIFLFSLLLSSCVSTESAGEVLSFIVPENIQQYYVRSIKIKEKEIDCDVDFTLHTKDLKICDFVTVNYTLNKNNFAKDGLSLSFEYDDISVSVQSVKLIYKDLNAASFRYTSLIDEESFRNLIYSSSPIYVVFTNQKGESLKIYNKKLENTIFKLREVVE